ncbi:hypothetical protein BJ138DRAFT_1143959 [Hygrophoropsis aurantiaca]|uniref:Uncharacterized protein n=1 Tax=Hygrophoropsis aurantiaca TaxID=72124 RepID=A0ACB8ALY7_9AGAM|nr:hypothetical protein BJ138DRAFT_1143959 [Hygrophoropsis aurantiaca]
MIPAKRDKFSSIRPSERSITLTAASTYFPKLANKLNRNATNSSTNATPLTFNGATHTSILSTPDLPPPGPEHYAARRALWLTPTKLPQRSSQSSSRQRLEHLLHSSNAVYSEAAWKGGVDKVWKGLIGGGRLKRRLPMALVLKVVHAGWLRDPDTWPSGAVGPESDDDFLGDRAPMFPVTMLPSDCTSSPAEQDLGKIAYKNPSGLVADAN